MADLQPQQSACAMCEENGEQCIHCAQAERDHYLAWLELIAFTDPMVSGVECRRMARDAISKDRP